MTTSRRREGHLFLLEIGTEEIPARMIEPALRNELALGLYKAIIARGLAPEIEWQLGRDVHWFGTPRRLAVVARGLREAQPDREEEVIGPRLEAAYDASGRPTRAAEGFARAQAVRVEDLRRVVTPRGESVGVRRKIRGRPASDVLAEAIPPLVASMTFPKMMRWGAGEHRFVRPIHSIVALLDREVVAMTIAGVKAGRETFGHRVDGRARIRLDSAAQYIEALESNAVLADIEQRRKRIADLLNEESRRAGGSIAPPPGAAGGGLEGDPALLDEVANLVEWPCVISGQFDRAFLDLPAEILMTAMRHHQKYFSLIDASGSLLNRFLAVANTREDRAGAIRRGNEWVLRARLADARFFWDEDRKIPLAERVDGLERVTYHEKLGSYAAKTKRVASLAESIAEAFIQSGQRVDRQASLRAAALSKADLTTQMVKEFPELEGIVGGLYARADGLPETVARAIYGHYLPRGADDPRPPTPEAAVVSLADRLDTQAGIFLLGIVPTGSKDPYALRRSVLGACRIVIESRVRLSLSRHLDLALAAYQEGSLGAMIPRDRARAALLEFYRGRLQHLGEEIPLRTDSVRAALAASFDDPFDARLRMEALEAIRAGDEFTSLVRAHKRIKNILKAVPGPSPGEGIRNELLKEHPERALHRELAESRQAIDTLLTRQDYRGALGRIARLGPALDRFFEEVMVLTDDRPTRENRQALLRAVADLFMRVGDFSEIVPSDETVAPDETRARG